MLFGNLITTSKTPLEEFALNNKIAHKLAGLASAMMMLTSVSVQAQNPTAAAPAQAPVRAQMPYAAPSQAMPYRQMPYSAYRSPYSYSTPYRGAPMPYYGNPYSYTPRPANRPVPTPLPSNRAPVAGNRAPLAGNRAPVAGNRAPSAGNRAPLPGNRAPWGRGPSPWQRKGFGRGLPIDMEGNYIPWSSRFWNELGEGGRNPMDDMGDWIDPREPREGMAEMWDDMLNAPHDLGRMPGGWTAPSVVVPNPLDVQREFEDTAKDLPDEVRTQMDNINIQTW